MNEALVALAGTVTAVGAVTAALLLDMFTLKPPAGAAEVSVTVQLSLLAPVMDTLLQVIPLSAVVTVPVAPSATVEAVVDALVLVR